MMRLFRKRWPEPYRFQALATFNGEVMRGILHSPEWVEFMQREQARFSGALHDEHLGREVRPGRFFIMDEVDDA